MTSLPEKNIPSKALVIEKPNTPFVLKDIVLDGMREDEVLVEMLYSGVCHTDIIVQEGNIPIGDYPVVLGHEGAGIIRRVGKSVKKDIKEGDKCILSFATCQKCHHCQKGDTGTCPELCPIAFGGVRKDGSSPMSMKDGSFCRGQFFGQSSFSKYSIVTEQSVIKCDVSDEDLGLLAPLGCGYYTGAGTVMNVLKPDNTRTIAILGLGGVGITGLMAAKALNAKRIIGVDLLPSKLEMAKSLGATDVINASEKKDLVAAIKEIVPEGVDGIMDTTGYGPVIEQGIDALAHAGTLCLVGVPPPTPIKIDPSSFLISCKRLQGVIESATDPVRLVPELVKLYHEGKFPVDKLGRLYAPSEIDQALDDMKSGKTVKPILSWAKV